MAVSIIVSPFVSELEDGANVWTSAESLFAASSKPVSYTHLRAHETG